MCIFCFVDKKKTKNHFFRLIFNAFNGKCDDKHSNFPDFRMCFCVALSMISKILIKL